MAQLDVSRSAPARPSRIAVMKCFSSLPIQQSAGDGSVGVDAAIAKEGPVAADVFQVVQVHFAEQNHFFVVRRFGYHAAKGIAKEGASPELESLARSGIAAD